MLKLHYLQATHKYAFQELKIIQFARQIIEVQPFSTAIVFGSIFSGFHRGENRHENGAIFEKLVLRAAARFFDNFGLIERATCSKIKILDFLHRRNVLIGSAERNCKRSAEPFKTFRRRGKSNVSIFEHVALSMSQNCRKTSPQHGERAFQKWHHFLACFRH